ncbi:MAG: hypothetical protein IVW54_10230 [Candidatus Binataceae bacterium]|nr:hypothetical protein [Candidatus Binataceae bacterium]
MSKLFLMPATRIGLLAVAAVMMLSGAFTQIATVEMIGLGLSLAGCVVVLGPLVRDSLLDVLSR